MKKNKIAVIGKGKTGSRVWDLLSSDERMGPYSSGRPLRFEDLEWIDGAIVFTPAEALGEITPILMKKDLAVVLGCTGNYPYSELSEELKCRNMRWIRKPNFAPSMDALLFALKHLSAELPSFEVSLKEIHHTQKLDAPSGTALLIKKHLERSELDIKSEREGDTIGIHQIGFKSQMEEITITHKALDRNIFASGAIETCRKLLNIKNQMNLPFGLLEKIPCN